MRGRQKQMRVHIFCRIQFYLEAIKNHRTIGVLYIYIHTHTLCIKEVTNENLLYSTRNYTQCFVVAFLGMKSRKEIYVYI